MWLDRFNDMRKNSGMSLDELSARSGVPKGTLSKITSGITKAPTLETMKSLVYAMGGTLADLDETSPLTKSDTLDFSADELTRIKKYRTLDEYGKGTVDIILDREHQRCTAPREVRRPNVIPFRRSIQPASAGTGAYLGPEEFETIFVQENPLTLRASFGVPVQGDSMEPRYHDGDILLIEGAEDIAIGEVGVFTIDGEGYVKERGDGVLLSLNPAYAPILMSESIWCNGRVIGILSPEWIEP